MERSWGWGGGREQKARETKCLQKLTLGGGIISLLVAVNNGPLYTMSVSDVRKPLDLVLHSPGKQGRFPRPLPPLP